ncbi:nuclear body protein SP140-like protein isoform X2 [Mastacembelus armatus]|uniref:SP110 nuclear antigen, tandem duplicate 1 n=1 Tax=Mastacembelus armatus TaxID=205130 RepID=A0A3Q3L334_9TELE|nr:nuclear body protein SP140-like protein isoform X2 [Mastacembelus armatus]
MDNPMLDFLESEELLRFFHCNKTEMSLMENPQTFLRQLRDYDLIPDDRYKKVSRMKSKERIKKGLYEILDRFECERPQHIHRFWRCVFKDTIMNQYPTLRLLRNSLMDGTFHFDKQLPEMVETKETDEKKRKVVSEDEEDEEEEEEEEKRGKSVKKRKQRNKSTNDEEQPGPSSHSTPDSPLKKGEKSDIWNWKLFKAQMPVTCGDIEAILSRDRLAKGEKCILFQKSWFTPTEFEKRAGKGSSKNWKTSIRCKGTTLGKLIQEGHLKSGSYKRRHKMVKRSLFPSAGCVMESDEEDEEEDEDLDGESSTSDTDEEEDKEQAEPQTEVGHDRSTTVFKVTCRDLVGTLHKKRFASGNRGKCIRTETSWMSPVEFVNAASDESDPPWKREIQWEGKPLNDLIENKILRIHSLLCVCDLCDPNTEDEENQKNDDECYICRSQEETQLVVCDDCPRSFHQRCHLPHLEDAILNDKRRWMCTFCVFKANQPYRYCNQLEMREALSLQMSQHLLECQYVLLYLWNADEEKIFASDPRGYLTDYSTVIQTPMWLGHIANKLQENNYQTVEQFVSDVQLIFSNCARYNRDNAEFLAKGDRLKKIFDGKLKNVFNIS